MNRTFSNNLLNLRQANTIFFVFSCCFALFPILFEKDVLKALVYIATALIALALAFIVNYIMQKADVNNKVIYFLTAVYYTNIMAFGIYISVLSNPDDLASIFLCFLICALLMCINSPLYNLMLTSCAVAVFIIAAIVVKKHEVWIYDVVNAVIAAIISLYFCWQITRLRLGLELSTSKLEEERNKYRDQSILDELTQLRNRRDYMNTFQRFLSNYRASDDWMCVAISDIDFFKNYNDHYGHPKGDDCLRSIGGALNGLKESMGVYAARVGGEEFSLLWFEKEASHVDDVILYMIKVIRDLKIPHEKSKASEFVTMSIGLYIVKCGTHNDTQVLYDLADKALYAAKASGRNCAIVCGDEIKQYKITPPSS
ncbi:MAG: GGDEF domain-containing protein [Treponema sp.]|jgi:diguanylate cyclase (GGDEF)-like protein|nr:GGDEF domain-containing protein [Treponema sp.]